MLHMIKIIVQKVQSRKIARERIEALIIEQRLNRYIG